MQHGAAHQRIALLQLALATYVADPGRFGDFAKAFDAYADFYRGHMMLEEDVVLPLVRRYLTVEDWVAVDAEFAAEMQANVVDDESKEDFKVMFSKIVDCAPAPIGFGPAPYRS